MEFVDSSTFCGKIRFLKANGLQQSQMDKLLLSDLGGAFSEKNATILRLQSNTSSYGRHSKSICPDNQITSSHAAQVPISKTSDYSPVSPLHNLDVFTVIKNRLKKLMNTFLSNHCGPVVSGESELQLLPVITSKTGYIFLSFEFEPFKIIMRL